MKLQECVENIEIEDGKFIHIGSGCGFFFVGTKEEFEMIIYALYNLKNNDLSNFGKDNMEVLDSVINKFGTSYISRSEKWREIK